MLFSVLFLIITLSIIFSGNRMPLILFILSIILILFTNQTLKKYFLQIFILITLILTISIYSSPKLKNYYKTFYEQTIKIISHFIVIGSPELVRNYFIVKDHFIFMNLTQVFQLLN